MIHPPPNKGAPRAALPALASPSPSHGTGEYLVRKHDLLPDSKDLRFGGGVFLLCVALGGATAGGLGFSAGAGHAGEALRGLAGVEVFIPQLNITMSSSEHPSHPNSPRAAQQGVLAVHVSVRQRERCHSRSPERMAHPRWGLSSSS